MSYDDYTRMRIATSDGIAMVTIDHPPINLIDVAMLRELGRAASELTADDQVRVVVVDSADPDFFIAHFDAERLLTYPVSTPGRLDDLDGFNRILEAWRRMPKATIAMIEGAARGGGSEFALALDMRFAAIGQAVFCQPEVALGIVPGAGGTQRLTRATGRARALEAILSSRDVTALEAEAYGWINRALEPSEIRQHVEELARRIAAAPLHAIALAKEAVDAVDRDVVDGLLEENLCFQHAVIHPEAMLRIRRVLDGGMQTRTGELDWEATLALAHGD